MNRKSRGNRAVTLVIIFICVALFFAIAWAIVTGLHKLTSYGESATIQAETSKEETTLEVVEPEVPEKEEALPKNSYSSAGFFEVNGIRHYRSDAYEGIPGVDVSSYQDHIDWALVKDAGVEFAIVRVGYRGYKTGELEVDDSFVHHLEGALAAGLEVGVYFFSQALTPEEAAEEAAFVIDQIRDYPITYPVVFDWEEVEVSGGARTDDMNMLLLTSCAQAFCETVQQAGYEACVYFNQTYGYQQFNLISLKQHQFWLAEYAEYPSFVYDFHLWQYTNEGSVPGISGPVDLNIAFRKKS